MENSNLLDGFVLSNYRSFGSEPQKIGPLKKINLFVGQNNSGKSNILLFIKKHYNILVHNVSGQPQKEKLIYDSLDYPIGSNEKTIVGFPINFSKLMKENNVDNARFNNILNRLKGNSDFNENSEFGWIYLEASRPDGNYAIIQDRLNRFNIANILDGDEWVFVNSQLGMSSTSNTLVSLNIFSQFYIRNYISPIKVELIPAIRKVGLQGTEAKDFSGEGIIERLAKLQNPNYTERNLKNKFELINQFLRNVLENESAELEVPFERDTILVHMDNKILPLASLGTGIHEVIILAVAVTYLDNYVICIEEPELHLHPLLQKKFIRYVKDNTSNQYMISTHSAHILDIHDTSIFHVKLENGQTKIDRAINPSNVSLICDDLGYRASDIIQSNCIIWVEGPSDRIYLRDWIRRKDNTLMEGINYSIMFYGGRLLSHLSANDPEVGEFISLRWLNRWICILIDSDKVDQDTELNATKNRVIKEFDEGKGFAWVTEGREIENYIPPDILEKSINSIHKNVIYNSPKTIYENAISYKRMGKEEIAVADKIKLASFVVKQDFDIDRLDLENQLNRLVKFIHEANGLKK
jgi:AAA15 family ATPase/GTPase